MMTTTVNIHEAKTHLSRLLRRVEGGERIIIANAGRPVAELGPVTERPAKRIPGRDRGLVIIHPEFDGPLPEFEEYS